MENARVALFENNQYVIELIEALVKRSRSQIVAEAHSFEEASTPEFIDILESERVDIAIVDQAMGGAIRNAEIISKIRDRLPGVTVLALSEDGEVSGADRTFIKPDINGMIDTIIALPARLLVKEGK